MIHPNSEILAWDLSSSLYSGYSVDNVLSILQASVYFSILIKDSES